MALTIGIAGLGTVGQALVSMIEACAGRLGASGTEVRIGGVTAASRSKARDVNVSAYEWADSAEDLAVARGIDVFVELIGGSEGPARRSVEAALASGKHVVTANKALLAMHSLDLARAAEAASVSLRYEAAVAGGTPVVEGVRTGAAALSIERVSGILNGTCNFILSAMASGGSYDDALRAAQDAGFAEADPSADVDGFDAAHKLVLLAINAFGAAFAMDDVTSDGIGTLSAADMAGAEALGARIKLVASAIRAGDAASLQVGPCLVPIEHPFAAAEGPGNVVSVKGVPLGEVHFAGPGAGGGATASAVAADLVAIAQGISQPVFSRPAEDLRPMRVVPAGEAPSAFYIRVPLETSDETTGSDVMAVLEAGDLPIESFRVDAMPDRSVHLHVVTGRCAASRVAAACRVVADHRAAAGTPHYLPFLDTDS